ncbi:MAG TPA: hypothetical protein VFS81_04175, partial [Candidatus Binatia bacterium]|nr:hypothetical protein [Candidatus Binatia bacterium]
RAGFGKAFPDLWRGIKQAAVDITLPTKNASAGLQKEQDEVRLRDAPLMSRKAAIGGNILGNVAAATPTMLIPGVNTYTGAAAVGAGLGALQPVGTEDSRALNAGLGAAGGVVGKYVGGKVGDWANRVTRGMSAAARAAQEAARAAAAANATAEATGGVAGAENAVSGTLMGRLTGGGSGFGSVGDDASAALTRGQQKLLQRGGELGMEFTPGQATGSKALQQLEAKLSSQPMTSGPFFAKQATNTRSLNREVAAAIGEASDVVDDTVLNRAATRLGEVFESAKDDVARTIDPAKFLGVYKEIAEEVRGVTKGFAGHPLVDDLISMAEKGSATGKQLQPLTSKLGKAAYKEMSTPSGDRELGLALYRMKDYVDDLLQSGMNNESAQVFQAARGQYRNLMNILSRTNIVNPSTGNVNGRALAQMLQQRDRAGFTLGRNRTGMYDAARVAQAFQPIVGDSGTATRSMITNPLEMIMSMPFNLASRAYVSAPSVKLATGVQAAARPAAQMSESLARALLEAPAKRAPVILPGASAALATELPRY